MTLPLQPTWWLDSIRPLPMTFTYASIDPHYPRPTTGSDAGCLWPVIESQHLTRGHFRYYSYLLCPVDGILCIHHDAMPFLDPNLDVPWLKTPTPTWALRLARPTLLSMSWLRPPPFDVHCSDCCVCKLHMTNNGLWIIDRLWHSMTPFTLTLILNWIHLTLWPWKSISFLDLCLTPHTWPFPCLYSLIMTGPSFMVTSKELFLLTCLTHLVMTLMTVTMRKRRGPNTFTMVPHSFATGRYLTGFL